MKIYFEDETGYILQVEPDCPCSRGNELLLAKDVLMGESVEVHTANGWVDCCRANPNQKLNFILQVEAAHWADAGQVYYHIKRAMSELSQTKDGIISCTLSRSDQ